MFLHDAVAETVAPCEGTEADYDFAKYGASAERQRLIGRWEKEIGGLPR